MLIERFMPEFDVAERHRVLVLAPSERAYQAVRQVDLSRSAPSRMLFTLRGLPALLRRDRGSVGRLRRRTTIDDLQRAGFTVLDEDPPVEIVLGIVGRFWRPTGAIRRVPAEEFEGFADPGYAVATWNFRVTPGSDDRCMVSTETRVRCTDDASRKKFFLYWAVIGPFSGMVRKRTLRLIKAAAEAKP